MMNAGIFFFRNNPTKGIKTKKGENSKAQIPV
jgi:hypothetical protein